ncbi:MAG: hypothetical protein ACR2P0_08245 [Acidimicrobiales bacterium]
MSRLDPPSDVTASVFAEWRNARRGRGQAEVLDNALWAWLVDSGHGPYVVNEHFGGPASMDAGPGWTNERYGQSETELPDGRTVLIAGEHEDYYDPDFFIYNDVIIRHPGGETEILGYGTDVFPPTDYHTATLVGSDIVLIGNLGYQDERRPDQTQVLVLDTTTWHVTTLATTGKAPGWIHRHEADLADDSTIRVSGGLVVPNDHRPGHFVENHDDWLLDLATLRWSRETDRAWPQWHVARSDDGPSDLWRLRTEQVAAGRGGVQSGPLEDLYQPPIPHVPVRSAGPGEFNVFRIEVDNTVVRYIEEMGGIRVIVEGALPIEVTDTLIGDLQAKLAALESFHCSTRRLA